MPEKNRIAVGSGKGGAGKSTTSVNLALYYSKKGHKTLLIDLDPLSDIKTIFDIEKNSGVEEKPFQVFSNLYILTPFQEAGKTAPEKVYEKIANDKYFSGKDGFEIIIFDLPAGSDERENLAFLDFADILLVVTNSEPAAHVACGGYIKKASEKKPELPVFIWHNRYEKSITPDFNQDDVLANYNKNMPDAEKLEPAMAKKFLNVAKIPRDSSLDLLGTDTTFGAVALRNMNILLELLYSEITYPAISAATPGKKLAELINSFLGPHREIDDDENIIDELFEYIGIFVSRLGKVADAKINLSGLVTEEEREKIKESISLIRNDKTILNLKKAIAVTSEALKSLEDSSRMFYAEIKPDKFNSVVREITAVLDDAETRYPEGESRYLAGVLLFYLAVLKMIKADKYHEAMTGFIPSRKDKKGNIARDRHEQIRQLAEKNLEYQKKFIDLVKELHLPLMEELEKTAKEISAKKILFTGQKNGKTKINTASYAKLLGNYLHDSLNSGLSIIIGFPYRTASIKFQKSAELVLGLLNDIDSI